MFTVKNELRIFKELPPLTPLFPPRRQCDVHDDVVVPL